MPSVDMRMNRRKFCWFSLRARWREPDSGQTSRDLKNGRSFDHTGVLCTLPTGSKLAKHRHSSAAFCHGSR